MYAVIKTGGKQYRVKKDDVIYVEKISQEKEGKISFPEVLFVNIDGKNYVGAPYVKATVSGEILGEAKGEKKIAFQYRKRKDSKRKVGSRPIYHKVRIDIEIL